MLWPHAQHLIALLAVSSLITTPALAKKAATMRDLNGANAAGAESQLRSRGFEYADGRKGDYGESYSYWWDKGDKDCVVVEVTDGRVMTINDASKSDCHHSDGNAGAAVAAVAGAALIGALLLHKSDHHEDRKHYDNPEHDSQYERGYNDGLFHRSYHNYDSSKYYSNGYSAGVQQRNNHGEYHHGYGGYDEKAKFKDLNGSRASGADGTLRSRGFVNVDGFKSGSTAYTIWNRRASRQCLQMTVADGRVQDIRDINTHPKCR